MKKSTHQLFATSFPFSLWLGLCMASLPLAAQQADTNPVQLPFAISAQKRMPASELEDKKEGTFITGVPRLQFDPVRGFGAGGNVNLFINKDKNDPFFEYTPYRHRLNAEFFIFENGRVRYAVNYDAPYIFNSKWRLRADVVVWEDPEAQFWGIGRAAMNDGLSFRDKRNNSLRQFNRMRDYEAYLAQTEQGPDGRYYTNVHFNNMIQRERLYNFLFERVALDGRLRLMLGYEALFNGFQSYNGRAVNDVVNINGQTVDAVHNETRVDQQLADGTFERFRLAGFNNNERLNFTSMFAWALIYDTRDFEPDPSKGVFLQYSHEYSAPWAGSHFNFNKFLLQGQLVHTLVRWRGGKSRLTFAGLAAFGHIFGPRISFIEMWDLSSQAEAGGILVMGGERSLRGFREARFVAPTAALINLELRSRLYDLRFLKQHLSLGLTPFFDMGSVWDKPSDLSFSGWRAAPGLGGRIAWNQSTIVRLDYGHSREGGQFFFGFGQIF